MTTRRAAFLAAAALLASFAAPPLGAQGGARWTVFDSPAGRFRAAFPGPPLRKEGKLRTEIGEVHSVRHTADDAEATYDVAYNDYPAAGVAKLRPEKLLDTVRDGLVYQAKGSLAGEKPFRMGKVSGRDLEIAGGDGTRYLVRMFLVGTRLYQLTALARPPAKPDIDRFFDSFQLTGFTPP